MMIVLAVRARSRQGSSQGRRHSRLSLSYLLSVLDALTRAGSSRMLVPMKRELAALGRLTCRNSKAVIPFSKAIQGFYVSLGPLD